jgi:DNA-directed RNA polymerase specialized sigma24 family protein
VVSVELCFFAGLSVAETAARMGRSDEAVKKLQARALANLRRLLAPAAPGRVGAGAQQFRQAVA